MTSPLVRPASDAGRVATTVVTRTPPLLAASATPTPRNAWERTAGPELPPPLPLLSPFPPLPFPFPPLPFPFPPNGLVLPPPLPFPLPPNGFGSSPRPPGPTKRAEAR